MCPLHGRGHNMNSCKVILAQTKAMNLTWLTARVDGKGRVRLQGAKKLPAKGEDMNALVANTVQSVLTTNKLKKDKASSESVSE